MPNRLAEATSPYLLQHADNPVDWYEWGDEAFAKARRDDRPLLLSVGYAACHWCHVMAHESFEDDGTAKYMNENFVNVKVDREERPDIDRIYMDAVQAMTGRGGWPMTVFLTPQAQPFYAGTYFPKEPRGHHPTFMQVLSGINAAWRDQRSEIEQQAENLTDAVRNQLPEAVDEQHDDLIERSIHSLEERFDSARGGFGGAPKFPQAPTLELLLRVAAAWPEIELKERALQMLTKTLDEMAAGGIYDHLYGGFARYSVDAMWLVPHFEKMLYDNALLARLYTHAWSLTKNADYRRVAVETLDYMASQMRHPSGGILSAEDADSEGAEGRFAVWSAKEFAEVTAPDGDLMVAVYGVTEAGNFEGENILQRQTPLESIASQFGISLEELTERRRIGDSQLVARRQSRVPPAIDDKVVMAWNGLAMRSFAEAAVAFERIDYLEIAVAIANFAKSEGTLESGRLIRAWRNGQASGPGYCDDYAALAIGLFALYQATGDEERFADAIAVTDEMIRLFAKEDGTAFYASGSDMPELIARPVNLMDNPTPSDNSLAVEALVLRAALTGETELNSYIDGVTRTAGVLLAKHPTAIGHLLAVLAGLPMRQLAVVDPSGNGGELLAVAAETYRPSFVVARGDTTPTEVPLLRDRSPIDGKATAFVCEGFACKLPTVSPDELRVQLAHRNVQIPGAPT